MGMALSGLASGFDWKSIVDQLIEVSRAPQNRMRTEKSANASKSSAINDIKGLLGTLKTSISSLATEESLYKKGVTFKDASTNWKATASKDTPAGEYKFNLISEASASKLSGSSNLVAPLDPTKTIAEISVGRTITAPGFFTVNGQRINVASTDTLQKVINDIKSIAGTADLVGDQIQIVSLGSPLSLGAPNDTSNFLQAMQLSGSGTKTEGDPSITTDDVYSVTSSASSLSAPRLNVALKDSGLAGISSGVTGSLEINGESVSYNSDTDTISTILDKINASKAGVSAIFDISQRVFSLTNKTTGNVGISVIDNGPLGGALGLTTGTTTNGNDATFSINGGGILTSRSNILDETAHGIKGLSVTANKIGEQTLTVAGDYTAAKDSLNDFISKYNAVQNAIEKYTKVTVAGDKVSSAILAGNRELSTLSRSLRTMLYQSGAGITGSVQRLSDLGINFAGIEPTISLTKSSQLESKLATAADDIAEYFSTTDGGLIDRLDTLLSSYVSDSGSASGGLKAQLDSITNQNKSLDKQIEDVERRLASQRSLLESSFIAMERAQSGFQQQSAYLAKTFNNSK
jgi:flagellar hook-associated protein 2